MGPVKLEASLAALCGRGGQQLLKQLDRRSQRAAHLL
jgi:hypothetical protein